MSSIYPRYASAVALGVLASFNVHAASGTDAIDQQGSDLGVVISQPMGGSQAMVAMEIKDFAQSTPVNARGRGPGFSAIAPAPQKTRFVELLVTSSGITHPYAPYVYFDDATCRGVPYISAAASRSAADVPAAVAGAQAELYVASSRDPLHVDAHSVMTAEGCRFFNHTVNVLPALWTMSLNRNFVLPIHW